MALRFWPKNFEGVECFVFLKMFFNFFLFDFAAATLSCSSEEIKLEMNIHINSLVFKVYVELFRGERAFH